MNEMNIDDIKNETCKLFLKGEIQLGGIFDRAAKHFQSELAVMEDRWHKSRDEYEELLAYLDETDPIALEKFRIFRARTKRERANERKES